MSDDDDLPVLTQVLRTASGHRPPPTSLSIDERAEPLDVRPFSEPLPVGHLVIGNEPHRTDDDDLAPPFEAGAAPSSEHDAVADPRHLDARAADAFVLPQDNDAARPVSTASPDLIEEPDLLMTGHDDRAQPLGFDTHFKVPSDGGIASAAQVREIVLDELMTRIDTELDARIAQAMHAAVETALAQLQNNLRTHLTEALRDVVGRAVEAEIARLNPDQPSDTRH